MRTSIALIFIFLAIIPMPVFSDSLLINVSDNHKITATYYFDEPREKLEFLNSNRNGRLQSWKVITPCVNFDGASIEKKSGCTNFSKLEIELIKNIFYDDRQYPVSVDFYDKEKSAINMTYFLLSSPIGSVIINFEGVNNNYIFSKGRFYKKKLTIKSEDISGESEYLYFGKKILHKDRLFTVIDKSLPKWINNIIANESVKIHNFYENKLSSVIMQKNMLMAAYYPQSKDSFWWGDVDKNGTISLRFYGSKWNKFDRQAYNAILMFVAHEIFHLFNSGQYTSSDSMSNPWLHEGSAESAAAIALLDLGLYNLSQIEQIFSAKFNSCYKFHSMKTGDANTDRQLLNRVYYDCGFLINFSYKTNRETGLPAVNLSNTINYGSNFSHWKNIFIMSKLTRKYDKSIFFESRNYNNELGREDYEALVAGDMTDVNPVENLLKKLHVSYTDIFTAEDKVELGRAIINSILIKNCQNTYGSWLNDGIITIEHNSLCKGFKKNMVVDKINGFHIFEDAITLHHELNNSCGSIVLTNKISQEKAVLDCPTSLPEIHRFKSIAIH